MSCTDDDGEFSVHTGVGVGLARADGRTQGDVRESGEPTAERGVQDLSCTDDDGEFSAHTGVGVAQALTPHVRRVTYVSRASRRPNVG